VELVRGGRSGDSMMMGRLSMQRFQAQRSSGRVGTLRRSDVRFNYRQCRMDPYSPSFDEADLGTVRSWTWRNYCERAADLFERVSMYIPPRNVHVADLVDCPVVDGRVSVKTLSDTRDLFSSGLRDV